MLVVHAMFYNLLQRSFLSYFSLIINIILIFSNFINMKLTRKSENNFFYLTFHWALKILYSINVSVAM